MPGIEAVSHNRSGRYVLHPAGYRAFHPSPLPPDPPLVLGPALLRALSRADVALGRLDGAADILPNPDLFVGMYVRQEAVLSSQIEGTQASLTDLLDFEAGRRPDPGGDVEEVVNHVRAMKHGLARLAELPLSLRLLREIHGELLDGVRGRESQPGEFRRRQNWIGPPGSTLETAAFVPPPVDEMRQALGRLEGFLHEKELPVLVRAGLVHAQFETIHPFLDGNGRMGRLLVTFMLCAEGVLSRPLLYLSHYLKRHRAQYYDRLQAVRIDGAWEEWLGFFLAGVIDVAEQASATARRILSLREEQRQRISAGRRRAAGQHRALDHLFEHPVTTVEGLATGLRVTYATANALAGDLVDAGVLVEATGQRRGRRFRFAPYLALFSDE